MNISIIMLSYNQDKYIKKSIESILSQNFNSNFELLIADDNSNDESHNIINEIISTNPNGDKISFYINNPNLGMARNYKKILSLAKGKYLAFCEGDDYWIDNNKLQMQFDFLESNPSFNACVSKYKFYYEETEKFQINREILNTNKDLYLKDYLAFNFSHTSTFFVRNNFKLPDWVDNWVFSVDQCLMIYSTQKGKIKYMNNVFSVYRMHNKNQTNNQNHINASKRNIDFLNNVNKDFNYKYDKLISNRLLLNKLFWLSYTAKSKLIKLLYKSLYFINRFIGVKFLSIAKYD